MYSTLIYLINRNVATTYSSFSLLFATVLHHVPDIGKFATVNSRTVDVVLG